MAADHEALNSVLAEYVDLNNAIAITRKRMDELKLEALMLARELYPEAWQATVDLQESSLTLTEMDDGTRVQIPVSRSYDPDQVRAMFGEDDPELIKEAIEVKETVRGTALEKFWRRADTRPKVMACLKEAPTPTLRVIRPRRKAAS